MAYKQHHRVTFGGELSEYSPTAPDEIWACNVNVTGRNAESFDEEAYLDAIVPHLSAWFASPEARMSNLATLTYVKCNQIDPDGKYSDTGHTHRRDITPKVQGAAGPVDPDIISIALSWTTGVARGPGAHGRIYPPNATVGPSGKMTVTPADAQTLATGAKNLLTLLGNADNDGPSLFPVIASKVNATNTTITGVKVGNVKDVQRRRKSAMHEVYTYLAAPPS